MNAKLKCSKCDAELSDIKMSWDYKKQWIWILVGFLPMIFVFRSLGSIYPPKSFDNFTFEKVEIQNVDGKPFINGELKNNGDKSWSSITIEVEFFNKDKKFIGEISEYMRAGMRANSKENFSLRPYAAGFKIDEIDSHSIRVVDGRKN